MRIERLVWDPWNLAHIRKHGVTPEDVEDVVTGSPTFEGTYKGRTKVVGPAASGRLTVVIIGPVPGTDGAYYAFSSRPASPKERREYEQHMGGDGT